MDPLRSFTALLGSLWRTNSSAISRGETLARAGQVTAQRNSAQASTSRSTESLRSRLRARVGAWDLNDAERSRDAFVETVLAWQFGDGLRQDPQLPDMVKKLSEHIGAQPGLTERLTGLLRELAQERPKKR